jgi:DNA-binding GntR family transcriptional regulator
MDGRKASECVVPSLRKITSKPARLADRVYTRLMGAILEGTIAQGDRLIQETLAEELAVSRTPVREALLRLEAEGVLEKEGRKGFVVKVIDEKMIRSIYQAREAVEGYAAQVVAEKADAKAVDRLERRLES